MTDNEQEEPADLVDVFYQDHVRPLGNLWILCGQAEAALLELVTALIGDEEEAHKLLNTGSPKERVDQLVRGSSLKGFDLEELRIGIASFWDDKEERNRLIHDDWFPNNAGSPMTRGLKRKNAEEVFGEPTVTALWSLASRFRNHRDLFSATAYKLSRDGIEGVSVVADAAFILDHAERLVSVAFSCVVAFGLTEGLNDELLANLDSDDDGWRQATLGFEDGTLKRAVILTHLLLDRDERMVSFQAVHSRLKSEPVRVALKQALSEKFADDDLHRTSRDDLIAAFRQCYSRIDWTVHRRLTHFRNRGVAHLAIEKLTKRITIDELRELVAIISQLTEVLQQLCQTEAAFRSSVLREYRDYAAQTVLHGRT